MNSYLQQMQIQRGLKSTMDRYGGPMGLAGKIIGLGAEEIEAGIPKWSWFILGALAGGVVVYKMRYQIQRIAGD